MSQRNSRNPAATPSRLRDVIVAASCGAFVALMIGMAYAAVPLYDWFCRTTGFGGRTQVATSAPTNVLDRKVTVRFDANVAPGLPWRMIPERPTIEARLGDVVTVDYIVINEAARETAGVASYNVTPLAFGIYFQKINCFCFTEQRLKAGEKREMTVVFYVDPALVNDGDAQQHNTLTLSYTFHPQRPVAESNRAGGSGRI
jgi:cytochrome c oxidase assembly protein subunit 11